jgi:hypothetical protein
VRKFIWISVGILVLSALALILFPLLFVGAAVAWFLFYRSFGQRPKQTPHAPSNLQPVILQEPVLAEDITPLEIITIYKQ